MQTQTQECVQPDIITSAQICEIAPVLKGHEKLVERIMHWLILDKCNQVHRTYCHTTGAPFASLLVNDAYKIKKHIYNEEILEQFKDKPFVTVSNHPLGALDGIMLIDIIGKHRPDFKVMVNMFLNHISAMRPSFIPVDPQSSDDPEKKAVTMQGIRTAIQRAREGHPIGFFPAGAVSKIDRSLHITDRPWQPSIIRLIKQLRLPVIPVYFHEHNSAFFNFLGLIDWRIRTLRLPRELFNKAGRDMHVTFGDVIAPEEQAKFTDLDEFGKFLRQQTYGLKGKYHD